MISNVKLSIITTASGKTLNGFFVDENHIVLSELLEKLEQHEYTKETLVNYISMCDAALENVSVLIDDAIDHGNFTDCNDYTKIANKIANLRYDVVNKLCENE